MCHSTNKNLLPDNIDWQNNCSCLWEVWESISINHGLGVCGNPSKFLKITGLKAFEEKLYSQVGLLECHRFQGFSLYC